jgi:hypothetical protein
MGLCTRQAGGVSQPAVDEAKAVEDKIKAALDQRKTLTRKLVLHVCIRPHALRP